MTHGMHHQQPELNTMTYVDSLHFVKLLCHCVGCESSHTKDLSRVEPPSRSIKHAYKKDAKNGNNLWHHSMKKGIDECWSCLGDPKARLTSNLHLDGENLVVTSSLM
jgi:cytochrome c551/c552